MALSNTLGQATISSNRLVQLLRRVILFGTPAVALIATIIHPNFDPSNTYNTLAPQADLFVALHIVQLAIFGLLGLVVYLLLNGAKGPAADISRVALAVFVVLYPSFNAVEGIGTGLLLQYAKTVPPDQLPAFEKAIDAFFQNDVIDTMGHVGSAVWAGAVIAAAVALARAAMRRVVPLVLILIGAAVLVLFGSGVIPAAAVWWWAGAFIAGVFLVAILFALVAPPRVASGLLVLAAFFFGMSHVFPTGTVGMAALLLAVTDLEFFVQRAPERSSTVPSATTAR
jgi:hypothetical protein